MWSCVDGGAPFGPDGAGGTLVSLPLQATLVPTPADSSARPINRIRAVAERVPDGQVLGSTMVDVSPADESWEVGLEIPITAPGVQVTVLLQLIHVDASGAESVEFSGRTAPIVLAPTTQPQQPVAISVVRGPTDNLAVTAVEISGAPGSLMEGDSATLSASVTTNAPGLSPVVFWSVLDPEIGVVTGSTVRALLPGTLRAVASAGPRADTVGITVTQRPASVALTPDTVAVLGLGSEASFAARVLDARGDTIAGEAVLWRVMDPAVAELVGPGTVRSLAVGRTDVEVRSAADTTLKASGSFRVDPVVADLAVSKDASRPSAEVGDTVVFAVAVQNLSGVSVGTVTVVDSLPDGLSVVGAATGAGDFAGGTWTVGDLPAGGSATLELTTVRTGGANGATLVNAARVILPDGFVDPAPANNRAAAVVVATQVPRSLTISPDSLALRGLGTEGTFTARVLDRRAEEVTGAVVEWSSLAPAVAESMGGGVFRSAGLGTATIEARVAGSPSVRDDARITVEAVAVDLGVDKAAGRSTVESGDTVTFTVTVTNHGASTAENVGVVDALPDGLSLVGATTTAGTFEGNTWSVGSLAPGASAAMELLTRAGSAIGGRELVNTVTVSLPEGYVDTNPSNDQASAGVDVPARQSDLGIVKTVVEPLVAAGLDATFVITVTNPGDRDADAVVVTERLPAGLTFVSSVATAGFFDPTTGRWSFPLPAGVSATLTVVATAAPSAAGSTLVNVAEITDLRGVEDPDPSNNRAEAAVAVAAYGADVRVSKSVDVAGPAEADTVEFTLVVRNAGPDTATNVVVMDTLPTGLDSLEVLLPPHATALAPGLIRIDTIFPGDSAVILVAAEVAAGTAGTTLTNTLAVASLDQADPDTLNNKATRSVSVAPLPGDVDIAVFKQVAPDPFRETDTVTFTVRAINLGTSDATGLVVRDSLAPAYSFESASATAGSYSEATWLWTIDTLAAGDTVTLTVTAGVVDGTGGTTQPNTAAVVALVQPDDNPANNASTVSPVVQKRTLDLSLAKSIDVASPPEGTKVVYTVTLRNHGPGSATGIQVLDSLPLLMALDSARATVGTVDAGGGQWTVPSLAAGDSAKLRTYHTVGLGAAGGTLTNRARVAALAQADTVSTNDTASVSVTVPTSTPPLVTISAPVEGASFDPGDTITFSASASDFEDGDLTSAILWTSSKNGPIGSGATFSSHTLSAGPHTIVARVTDLSGTMSADTVDIILAIVGAPTTLNVPFGGTASLPISLSAPAPAGGLVLTVTSSAPGTAQPASATVTIPGGAFSANATIQGVLPGSATITVASAGYGSATTTANVTAALNITQGSVSFAQPFSGTVTVRLESAGAPIAAPAGGLNVTLTATNPACVAAPSPVTIPAGVVQVSTTLTWGGGAVTPCSTYVKASATSIVPDSMVTYVSAAPGFTVYAGSYGVGGGLMESQTVYLDVAAPAGGVTVRLESADPTTLLLSPNASTPGTAFIDVFVPAGSSYFSYYAHGLEGKTGSVGITASAPGYISEGASWSVVQPTLYIHSLSTSTTTLAADDPFAVRIGVPYSTYASAQPVRAGGTPVTVTIAHSTPATGRLEQTGGLTDTATVTIGVGQYDSPSSVAAGGVAFDPEAAGTTTISASAPGFVSAPLATQNVTVNAPALTIYGGSYGVGSGLIEGAYAYLQTAAPTGGVTVRIESTDTTKLLVSANASTPGTGFIDVVVPAGGTSINYWAQGVEGATGSVNVTAMAPAYTSDTVAWNVVQPALYIHSLDTSPTTLANDDPFAVRIGVPYSTYASAQPVRPGGVPITVTITNSTPATGRLEQTGGLTDTATVTIGVGQYDSPSSVAAGGVAFDAESGGATTLFASAPGVTSAPLATQTVTVTAPRLTVYAGSSGVGSGLQEGNNIYLETAAPAGGVTLHIESLDSTKLLLSPNSSTPGVGAIDVLVPAGGTSVAYYAHGLEGQVGTVGVFVTAPAYTADTVNWSVVQPGLYIHSLGTSPTTFNVDDPFQVRIGPPYSTYVAAQAIRAGGTPVTATITSSVPSVGQFTTSGGSSGTAMVTIGVGQYDSPATVASGGVALDPLTAGVTTVSATIPGFISQPLATQAVTVSAPSISVYSDKVASGLQINPYLYLGAANHGGVTVKIKSSAPGILKVSPNAVTPGTDSILVAVPNGQQYVYYFAQGMEGMTGTVTVTASAPGFTDGSATIDVVPAAYAISGLGSTTTAGAADDPFEVRVGYVNGSTVSAQPIRAGGTPLVVTITSSTPAVGQLTVTAGPGPSVNVTIPVGDYRSPTSVAAGGAAFDPLAAGSTSVTANIPGLSATPSATVAVTVNP